MADEKSHGVGERKKEDGPSLVSFLKSSCEHPQHTPSTGPCREAAQVHRVQSGKVLQIKCAE